MAKSILKNAKTISQRSGFIGKEKDDETSLGDFGVRKYDFLAGRFTSPDAMWDKLALGLLPNLRIGKEYFSRNSDFDNFNVDVASFGKRFIP